MLTETVFRTGDVPAGDRFDSWPEYGSNTLCPMDMSSDHAGEFRAETRLLQLGAVRVWPVTVRPMSWRRTPKLIRRSDPECYHLALPLHGTVRVTQAGRQGVFGPYEMHLADTAQPFECVTDSLQAVGVEVPKKLLPLPEEKVDRLLIRRLPGREGIGALLAGLLSRLARDTGSYLPSDGPRMETVLIDLLTATLAHVLDADDRLVPETRHRTLTRRIRAFVREHLHDPHLTPPAIAAAHHISVSYLHRIFQAEGTTIAAWIRRQRLERARRDLADPALRAVPIQDIAVRWGFRHHAAFTRAFRAAYGVPPRDGRPGAGRPGSGRPGNGAPPR